MSRPVAASRPSTVAAPLAVVFALVAAALLPMLPLRAATGDPVLINEVLVSHTGSPDDTEFLELFGTPGASLAGLSLLVVEGDSSGGPGTIDRRLDFAAGAQLGGNGFFLVGNPAGLGTHYGVVPDVAFGNDWFENGSQTVALVQTAGVGAAGSTVTGAETVVDSVGLTDAGPTDAWFFGAPVVGPDDGFLPGGARRVADGVDTDAVADWAFADDQLGATNTPTAATAFNAPPTVDCGPDLSVESGTPASTSVSATDPDGRVTAFDLAVTPDPGSVTLGATSPAADPGGVATTSVEVAASTPPGSYALALTAWNDDPSPQEAGCVLSLEVSAPPVPVPAPSMQSVVDDLVASGAIAPGKAHLLTQRLERVERFMERGMTAAARAQLRAFANQVRGLSPRWISPAAANTLIDTARELLAR
jgi:hypothetical protein